MNAFERLFFLTRPLNRIQNKKKGKDDTVLVGKVKDDFVVVKVL